MERMAKSGITSTNPKISPARIAGSRDGGKRPRGRTVLEQQPGRPPVETLGQGEHIKATERMPKSRITSTNPRISPARMAESKESGKRPRDRMSLEQQRGRPPVETLRQGEHIKTSEGMPKSRITRINPEISPARTAELEDSGKRPRGRAETPRHNEHIKTTERMPKSKITSIKAVAASKISPAKMVESKDNNEGPKGRITAYPRAELEKELLYLPDPLKLAENTLNLLRQDEHNKALEIVRYASRKMPCTVSWNHIIDYDMSKGRVTPAIKTYNEMKKRAQPPDAYTYTILLRGLAANHQYPQSLPRALSIYNSMYAENSPVRPSIIHTNAVLKVCSRANDIDALFEIAAKLPKRGKGASDNLTFTTIINAIWNALLQNPLLSADQHRVKRQEAVQQGRRMWEDIIGRWRNGDMLVDEEMVCAMARLLMLGDTPEDYDDVLSLFEQTMNIPRLVPRLGDPARQTHLTPSKASAPLSPADDITEVIEAGSQPASQYSNPDTAQSSPPPSFPSSTSSLPPTVFTPLPLTPSSVPRSHPVPSHQTLSALVSVCTRIHALRAASSYWTLLTTPPHSIIPDPDNLHTYLRLLRLSRASRQAVALLTTMLRPRSAGGLGIPAQPKTFRIAMSTCVRDAFNPSAPTHASAILTAMAAHLEEPDLRACEMFVVVLEKAATTSAWRPVLAGLDALEPVVANLRSVLSYGAFGAPDSAAQEDLYTTEERKRPSAIIARKDGSVTVASAIAVRLLLKRVLKLHDSVLVRGRESLAVKKARAVRERRERLCAFLGRKAGARSLRAVGKSQTGDSEGERGTVEDMRLGQEDPRGTRAVRRRQTGGRGGERATDEDMELAEEDDMELAKDEDMDLADDEELGPEEDEERGTRAVWFQARRTAQVAGEDWSKYQEAAWRMGVPLRRQNLVKGGARAQDMAVRRVMRAVERKSDSVSRGLERDERLKIEREADGGRRSRERLGVLTMEREARERERDERLSAEERAAGEEYYERLRTGDWTGYSHRWEGRGRVSTRLPGMGRG
ncbi:hypothetical protein MMC27_008381 [Xylographa pallens]|nr:hypothetical protein [Xylographa pallens]